MDGTAFQAAIDDYLSTSKTLFEPFFCWFCWLQNNEIDG
jgi:hypothetical protein